MTDGVERREIVLIKARILERLSYLPCDLGAGLTHQPLAELRRAGPNMQFAAGEIDFDLEISRAVYDTRREAVERRTQTRVPPVLALHAQYLAPLARDPRVGVYGLSCCVDVACIESGKLLVSHS